MQGLEVGFLAGGGLLLVVVVLYVLRITMRTVRRELRYAIVGLMASGVGWLGSVDWRGLLRSWGLHV